MTDNEGELEEIRAAFSPWMNEREPMPAATRAQMFRAFKAGWITKKPPQMTDELRAAMETAEGALEADAHEMDRYEGEHDTAAAYRQAAKVIRAHLQAAAACDYVYTEFRLRNQGSFK